MPNARQTPTVSLVIPAYNAERTLAECLQSVIHELQEGRLEEIIVVNDGSLDRTKEIAESFGVTLITTDNSGPGAARNIGWRASRSDLIWFIDSDCVAEPTALDALLEHFKDEQICAAGGSYGVAEANSLLARLVHEEIVERHLRMPGRVNFLASFNVMYRRSVLEEVGGFDESFRLAQDAELAYKVSRREGHLAFDARSRVKHYHPKKLLPYLKKQAGHGYWRLWLYTRHSQRIRGDSYSDISDHLQPPLAILSLATLALFPLYELYLLPVLTFAGTMFLQLPMTLALVRRRGAGYLSFALLGFVRAYARGIGLSIALLQLSLPRAGRIIASADS